MRTSLYAELAARNRPLPTGLIGAGKLATMFARQAARLPGLDVEPAADAQELLPLFEG